MWDRFFEKWDGFLWKIQSHFSNVSLSIWSRCWLICGLGVTSQCQLFSATSTYVWKTQRLKAALTSMGEYRLRFYVEQNVYLQKILRNFLVISSPFCSLLVLNFGFGSNIWTLVLYLKRTYNYTYFIHLDNKTRLRCLKVNQCSCRSMEV